MLEKSVNDLRMKLVDLETRSYKNGSGDGSFLAKRMQEVRFLPRYILISSWSESCKIENANSLKNRELIATLNGR